MATSNAVRRARQRNARLLADAGLPPAEHNPKPRRVVRFSTDARIERHSSTVERRQVPEEVGCTLTRIDWKQNLRTTDNSHSNSGPKLQHAQIGDGTLRTHGRRSL